jgi:pimeloyl-ACP methyl ester carboxylesterase
MTGLEPRFALPDSTPRSSRQELAIGGIVVYVYGLKEIDAFTDRLTILYLAHNRTRTYLVTEGIAHEVLHRYNEDKGVTNLPLIAVTFNMRNHGDRMVSESANRTWKDGNELHGIDLLSSIDGSADDFKLVMKYLPGYLGFSGTIYNVLGGVSLGAHTAWRLTTELPNLVGMFAVVGCPNLTGLLCSRLGIEVKKNGVLVPSHEFYRLPYDGLVSYMDDIQRARWPRWLHDIVRSGDSAIQDGGFPKNVKLLLQNGAKDPLVPAHYTTQWVNSVSRKERDIEYFVQENTGHSCTKEMVYNIAAWLGKILQIEEN